VKKLLARWLLTTAALVLTVYFVPAMEFVGEWWMIAGAAAALGLINMLIAPVILLVKIVTFPLSCLTLGLWTLLISLFANIAVFQFVSQLEWGFTSEGFLPSAIGAIVMSLATAILGAIFQVGKKRE
jgi:putative membrane protein